MTLAETLAELEDMAQGRVGRISRAQLARHVVAVTEGGDWPLRRAAMEAVLRPCRFGERDGLRVVTSPSRSIVGRYTTGRSETAGKRGRRPAGEPRPYTTLLSSVDPISGSCDCPDFLLGSLGLCKHLLCVLDSAVDAIPSAALERGRLAGRACSLRWDPVRPLLGEGDRLLGLRWVEPVSMGVAPAALKKARAWFRADRHADPTVLRPVPSKLGTSESRLRFLDDVDAAIMAARRVLRLEPATWTVLSEERVREERRLSGRADARGLLPHFKSLKRRLYPYQLEGARRFFEEERLLLADDMGLGKTTQAVAACHALYQAGKVKRGLLIVPASLKPQWIREWQATSDVPVRAIEGSKQERDGQYADGQPGFAVVGYEQLLRDLQAVHRYDPEIVVLDEAQRIKNWATKSHAYVKTLAPRYRLVLTGTPMENRLDELANVLDWLDEQALAPKWRLAAWHTYAEGDGAEGRAGAKNLDTLRTRLRHVLVRRVRRDVLDQLPSRTDTRVSVPMTDAQRGEHDELIPAIARVLGIARRRPLRQVEFLRLMTLLNMQRMISNGLGQVHFDELWPTCQNARPDPVHLERLFAPKLPELRRIVEAVAIDQGRKLVVFSQWRRMLRLAAWSVGDILAGAGKRAVFFTGAESQRLRTQNIVDFHDDANTAVMFLSDAGGVGLNLQRAASCCVNLELPWNPAVLEQRIGRIYRLGQEHPIDVYNLVCDYGIESRIAVLVASKKALFSSLFDGTTDEVRYESGRSSFLADVEKLVPEIPDLAPAADSDDDGPVLDVPEEAAAVEHAEAPSHGAAQPDEARVEPGRDGPPFEAREDVRTLLSQLRVERTSKGSLRIEAPPEAAASLAALFEGVARLLGATPPSPLA